MDEVSGMPESMLGRGARSPVIESPGSAIGYDGRIRGSLSMSPGRHRALCVILTATFLLIATGCGAEAETASADAAPPQVDPRFATAQSLADHYNTIATVLPPRLPELVPLFHVENEFQRKKLQLMREIAASPYYELEVEMYRRFGEGFVKSKRTKVRPASPAKLTKIEDLRAEGWFKDTRGKQRPLHLIAVDGRWWISGYTLEYETDTEDRELVEGLVDFLLEGPSDSSHVLPVLAELKAGKFKSAQLVRDAVFDAMRERIEQSVDD
jgi:hypothetical protein